MKLKNIIMALGVLAVLPACSDDSGEQKEKEKEVATLSIRVATNTRTTGGLRADDPYALAGEANINNLAAFLFSAVTLETVGGSMVELSGVSDIYQMNNIPASTGADPALIVLVANAPASAMGGITNYGQLQEVLAQLGDQQQSSLSMSTQVITTEYPLDNGANYIGFGAEQTNVNGITSPLWLTRLPARLEVTGARTNFTRAELLGRTVTVNSMYYGNVKTASYYFSADDWGVVQADGETVNSAVTGLDGVVIDNENPRTDLYYPMYVMENLNAAAPTQIVVSATLSATDEYAAETYSFTATINDTGGGGVIDGIDVSHLYVKRNFVYGITMTFGDGAFDGLIPIEDTPPEIPPVEPDPTVFSVAVAVMGWGEVEQNPELD